MSFRILADSASDIEAEEAKALGIEMIPMEITFGTEVFEDGVTLSHDRFFEKLIETDEMPKTSCISEYRFEEKFREMTAGGEEVICIALFAVHPVGLPLSHVLTT